MRKLFLLPILLFTMLQLFAQKEIPSFGKASKEELLMTSCPFEPSASAMKLFDVQEVEFEIFAYGGIKLKTERRVRIKVFNEKGYEHANIRIPYLSKKGIAKIKNLGGAIYTLEPDGKIKTRTLEKNDFFKDKMMENLGVVTFTFPNLTPGSVIEYRYTTVENNILSIDPWIIQGEIPVGYTSCSILTPIRSAIREKVFGSDSVEQVTELIKYDQFRRIIYHKKNIPSFEEESFMSSEKDHLIKVVFLLMPLGGATFDPKTIWGSAGRQLLYSKYVETQVGKVIPGTEALIDSAKKLPSTVDRISFLYQAMQKKWPLRIEQAIKLQDLTEAWKDNDGTSSEINLILLNLLEKADVKAVPVLVSTRDNGYIDKQFPSVGQFNGINIMAFDSSRHFLLDATIKNLSFDIPPANMLNREAFVLSPDSMAWVTITDARPLMKQSTSIIADMMPDGTIEGGTSIQYFDYAKAARLDTLARREARGDKNALKAEPGFIISNIQRDPGSRLDEPLFESYEFKFTPNNSDDFVFIDPQVLIGKTKNPFTMEVRNTDLDFGSNHLQVVTLQVNLNNAYEIDHLPPTTVIRAPDSSFFYSATFSTSGGKLYMTQIFEIKKAIFAKEDYAGIRDFYRQMHSLMAREIVLRKKGTSN